MFRTSSPSAGLKSAFSEVTYRATIVRPVFFMDNFLSMASSVEGNELVLRLPFPDGIKLQTVAVRDIGVVVATALLDPAAVPAAIEIAGDELTGSEIAATFGAHVGLSARYEALPVEVLNGQDDLQKMFRWFADTPAFHSDIAGVRPDRPGSLEPAFLAASHELQPGLKLNVCP